MTVRSSPFQSSLACPAIPLDVALLRSRLFASVPAIPFVSSRVRSVRGLSSYSNPLHAPLVLSDPVIACAVHSGLSRHINSFRLQTLPIDSSHSAPIAAIPILSIQIRSVPAFPFRSITYQSSPILAPGKLLSFNFEHPVISIFLRSILTKTHRKTSVFK